MMKMEQYFPTKRSVLLHLLLPCFLLNPCTADIFLFRCSSTKFAANTPYQSNLLTLLSSLSSNATGSTEFYNATVGITNEPNTVYGLFMCRGDVSHQLCQECVSNATQKIASYCWLAKQAIIWHQFCFVRYSNRYFFSHVDEQPQIYAFDLNNVSDGTSSAWTLSNTLNQVAGDAASCGPAGTKKFATKEARVSEGRTLYTLAQCTPDLSMEDCRRCLLDAIENIVKCCLGRTGGRVAYPSCKIRFEVYQFYWNVAMLPSTTAGGPRLKGEDGNRKIGSQMMVVIVVAAVVSVMLLGLGADFLRKRARKSIQAVLRENLLGDETTTLGSLQFNLATIEAATNKFSPENKIGKGGFGEVYKGTLPNGQEIAIKQLSNESSQGFVEFKNEVLLIAKLQHRNLVALLGFYLDEQEKILVYEYVPNKSLDYFLFDSQKERQLSWFERHQIIGGIAQAILYFDYMSSEYARLENFFEKSDIFSVGVMILEIITGKRNTSNELQWEDGLLSYVWKQWSGQTPPQILDSYIKDSYCEEEVAKCIQIGLLCVQEDSNARPSMSTVVSYISSFSVKLPSPQEPAFFIHSKKQPTVTAEEPHSGVQAAVNDYMPCSTNNLTTSCLFPR